MTHRALQRLPDWPDRLDRYVEARRHRAMEWGAHDCCQFVRQGLRELTGLDPARGWKLGRYRTPRGAARVLTRLGGIAQIPVKAGLQPIPVARAQRGDVMLCTVAGQPALGLCLGPHTAGPGATGLVFVPTLNCAAAWRLP